MKDNTVTNDAIRKKILLNIYKSRLRSTVSNSLREYMKNKRSRKKAEFLIGCSMEFFYNYIKSKFVEDMSFENYGLWHLDHIIPLSKFDLYDEKQLLIAMNYTNYQPLMGRDNIRKGGR